MVSMASAQQRVKATQEALVEDGHKFRGMLLGTGMQFMHKLKRLAAERSPEGSEFLSKAAVVRELVRTNPNPNPNPTPVHARC